MEQGSIPRPLRLRGERRRRDAPVARGPRISASPMDRRLDRRRPGRGVGRLQRMPSAGESPRRRPASGADVEAAEAPAPRHTDEDGATARLRAEERARRIRRRRSQGRGAARRDVEDGATPAHKPIRRASGSGVSSAAADRFSQIGIRAARERGEERADYMGSDGGRGLLTAANAIKASMGLSWVVCAVSMQVLCVHDRICFAPDRDADPAVPAAPGGAVVPLALLVMLVVCPACVQLAGADGPRSRGCASLAAALSAACGASFGIMAIVLLDRVERGAFEREERRSFAAYSSTVQWYYGDYRALGQQKQTYATHIVLCLGALSLSMLGAALASVVRLRHALPTPSPRNV